LKSDALSSLQNPVPPASPLLLVRPSIEVQSKGDSGGGGDGGAGDADEHGGVVQMSMVATQRGPAGRCAPAAIRCSQLRAEKKVPAV
jgi:hypothetical protein